MKKLALLALAPFFGYSIATASIPADADTAFVFTDVITIPTTSVKDQNKSGTCWAFAGTSYFENEIMRLGGDSLDISEMFFVRKCYEEKAERFIRLYGQANFSPGGAAPDVAHVWQRYGAMPEEAYPGINYGEEKHVHGELQAALSAYLKAVVNKPNKRLSTSWRTVVNDILDAYLGEVPETFQYNGKTYTPRSFADAQPLKTEKYVPMSSFSHHPYYSTFPLEVPDNWLWDQYYNLPLDEFKAVVDNSLENGFTVLWAADISEDSFKWDKGVALMPLGKNEADLEGTELARWVNLSTKERENEKNNFNGPVDEINVTTEMRQDMFDRQETVDDHLMEIVGTATDQTGKRYYRVKNSWDSTHIYKGYFYVSEQYFLAKTVSIMVNRDSIPKAIAAKLNLK